MKNTLSNKVADSKGFSLVELLAVIALVAIMSAIGIPAILSMIAHIKFTRDVRDIAVELGAARMNAISKNQRYAIYFTLSGSAQDTYTTQKCSTVVASACTAWVSDTARAKKTLPGSSDITSPGASFRVEFLPTGTATAINITVRNTGSDTEQMIINVNSSTGRITIT